MGMRLGVVCPEPVLSYRWAANSTGPWCARRNLPTSLKEGKYRLQEGRLPRFGFSILMADVAGFMIQAAEKRAFIGKVVGVCN
jgi:hypothetical protein